MSNDHVTLTANLTLNSWVDVIPECTIIQHESLVWYF